MQVVALIISMLALATSLATAWLTLLRRGTVRMTHPSIIFFGPDSGPPSHRKPKVYLRTLLFCNAKKGRVIESMHVSLQRNESRQNFSVWVNGDDRLNRGSGMFVGDNGVVANHHFLTPRDDNSFRFMEGTYRIEIFAKLVDDKHNILLFVHDLVIDSAGGKALQDVETGIYFDWGPDAGRYISHVERKSPRSEPWDLLEKLIPTRDPSTDIRQGEQQS